MKFKRLIIMLVFAAIGAVQSQTLDLESFLSRVLTHSKNLKLAVKQQELAAIQKQEAVATALPKIVARANYTHNLTDYYMYADMSALTGKPGVMKMKIKRNNEFSASIALQQTLFSPNVGSAIRAAKQYQKLTDFVYDASLQAITNGAKKIFYQCILLEKVFEVSVASKDNARENYETMKLRFDNGQISEFQLLQAEVRWKNAIPAASRARRNLELALNNLKNWAGYLPEEKIKLSGSFEIPAMPVEAELESILHKRPDFNAQLWENRLLNTNLRAKKSSFLPTLTGTIAHAYSAQSDAFKLEQDNGLTFAGLNLSIPIYLGGYRFAQIKRARVEVQKSEIKIKQIKENIYNEIANNLLRLKEARQSINSAESILKVARKAFKIAENTARSGLTTQLELKDARIGFDQAQLNFYAASYDYLAAYFDYEKTTGR